MSYEANRAWSDRFLPAIRAIVGPHLLEPSPYEVDTRNAADLVVVRARNLLIACRVRRFGYADRYPHEFTIRSKLDSGATTELEKMVNGWGDWMLYGHADGAERGLARWWLIDLSAWRAALIRERKSVAMQAKSNGDGTHFVAFDVRSFPANPPLIIAASHPLQTRREAA